MVSDFYHAFYYIALITAAIISLLSFKISKTPYRWLCFLMILTLLSELVAKYIAFELHQSNSSVYHFFTPIEYLMYGLIYKLFLGMKHWNKLIWLSVVGLGTMEVLNTIYFQPLAVANTNIMIAESILLVFLSLVLFTRIRETAVNENIFEDGVFWFNSAVLCYYSFNILIWGFHSLKVYLLKNPPKIIYDANLVISGLLYVAYVISIVLHAKSQRKILKAA